MTPELATEPPITRTADALDAELAMLDDVRPVPAGHCYRCGLAPCVVNDGVTVEDDGTCNRYLAEPLTLDVWLNLAAYDAVRAVGLRGRSDLVRDLVRQLGERITANA